jgi:RNA polymerase sigma factor (sigma-70 family)
MAEQDWLAQRFEQNRRHLRAVAYRMLGSLTEADDAVQETWLRLSRSETDLIENIDGWLTTVVGRVSLDMLRSRKSRQEEPLDSYLPDPVISLEAQTDPEREVLITDSVGIALLVVLDTLAPPERLAFVLHEMFAVPFNEIASILTCSSVAARQLASRARRKVRAAAPIPDVDLGRQREIVDAFLAAVRNRDFEGLLAVLDPDVVLRSERIPTEVTVLHGGQAVGQSALLFSQMAQSVQPILVNGNAGFISWRPDGRPFSVLAFTIRQNKIAEIDVFGDPDRLRRLDLAILNNLDSPSSNAKLVEL